MRSFLQPDVLRDTLSRLAAGTPREDVWQKEFYRVATSQLPTTCNLSAEVSHVFGDEGGGKRSIDFYVDGELQWMIEFLVEGRDLNEHVARFDLQRGRYRRIRRKDWLVVDFRSSAPRPSVVLPDVMYVLCSTDFTACTIVRDGCADEVVRLSGVLVRTASDL